MDKESIVRSLDIKHIGIIMDGNGRWAKKRFLPRKLGHSQGAKAFRGCLNSCVKRYTGYAEFNAAVQTTALNSAYPV